MWSGGKDSAMALDRARRKGLEVTLLLSFYDSATARVRFHGTPIELLQAQAAAIGIGWRGIASTWAEMDARFQHELSLVRAEGFTGVVLGDIHLADVRAWYEERVATAGLQHVEPLWGESPTHLLREFVLGGGRAVVTFVDLAKLDESWLGRAIDPTFAAEIENAGVDACGENGEYHSFAFDGPVFNRAVDWAAGERHVDSNVAQLDLMVG